MPSLTFLYAGADRVHTVRVTKLERGGDGWQVYCDNYYEGTIREVRGQWVRHGAPESSIQGDDWQGLIDRIDLENRLTEELTK